MTDGMQESLEVGATGSEDASKGGTAWWTGTEEVFRLEG